MNIAWIQEIFQPVHEILVPMELAGSGISDNPVNLQVSPAHTMKAWAKILASSPT